MKVKAIRSFVDKYTMQDIDKGKELEISKERFLELTEGPRGIFVEEIKEEVVEEVVEEIKEEPKKKPTKSTTKK